MRLISRIYFSVVFISIVILNKNITLCYAQMNYQQKYQLAHSYFLQKEYEKALPLLEELYEVSAEYWFDYYYEALINLKKYSEADKLTNKQLKKFSHRTDYYVYLGNVYSLQNNDKKAKQYYEKAINKLPNDVTTIKLTAKQFMKYQMVNYALNTYNKGQKITNYPFYYERAEIYQQLKDYKSLINLYLDILYYNQNEINNVQNQIQTLLAYNHHDTTQILQPILKQELIKRIQKYPENTVYVEFLVYLLIQQSEYEQAFIQMKAYDKRVDDEGLKLFMFCQTCSKNQQYSIAERCYEEIIKKGKSNPFYESSRLEYLQNKYHAITHHHSINKEQLNILTTQIHQYISENKNSSLIYPLVLILSDIYAKYIEDYNKADSLLKKFIEQQIKPSIKAEFKLKLADVYVLQGRLWEAILLCMQVEKDFKYEPLGQEAQYKRAKIAFYSGEFKLAKSQADILKGATSKLIANDALQLSMIISDALFNDSTGLPLTYLAKADLLIFQNKLDKATIVLDSINQKFADHSLGDDVFFLKARIYEIKNDWKQAEQMYTNIINYYPQDIYADDAVFNLANLYQNKLNDKPKAMEYYLKLLNDYPGSLYVPEARRMYRLLRGDEVN